MAKQSAGAPIPPVPSGRKPPTPVRTATGNMSPAVARVRQGPAAAHGQSGNAGNSGK